MIRRRLAFRRAAWLAALVAASVAALVAHRALETRYPYLQYLTGWLLLAFMLVLTGYNARKKLPFLPLLKSSAWLRLHIYLGLFTGLAFLLHARWRLPAGPFNAALAVLFALVTFSGVFGWWLSRSMPKRLTTTGGEVPFERIPIVLRDLRARAEALVLETVPAAKSTTLADFYHARLAPFFARPRHFRDHALGSRRHLAQLLDAFVEVDRFLGPAEKAASARLADLVRQKDAVDFQRAGQLLLRSWLFVHIPLTYGLLVFSAVHIVLVYVFSGGAR